MKYCFFIFVTWKCAKTRSMRILPCTDVQTCMCVFRVYYRSRGSWRRIWILYWSAMKTYSGDLWPLTSVCVLTVISVFVCQGKEVTLQSVAVTENLQFSLRVIQHLMFNVPQRRVAFIKVQISPGCQQTEQIWEIFQSNTDGITVDLTDNFDLGQHVPPVLYVFTIRRQKWFNPTIRVSQMLVLCNPDILIVENRAGRCDMRLYMVIFVTVLSWCVFLVLKVQLQWSDVICNCESINSQP